MIRPRRFHAAHVYEEVAFRSVSATALISAVFPTADRPGTGPNGELIARRTVRYGLTIWI
jgi:hypothetical protein